MWSSAEKVIARRAFERALQQDLEEVMRQAKKIAENDRATVRPVGVGTLSNRAPQEIDRQYDYRYSVLLSVFADLIQKGRLREQDLQGLSAEKLRHIHHMAQAGRPFVESAKSLGKPSPPLQPSFGLGSQRRSEYPPESRSS
jgi:hypothetical protein